MTPLSPPGNEPPEARVTIRDVARLAGVGIKTVSRVINGEPNVSEHTAIRVRQAIAQLRWEPDIRARNLRRADGRTHTIGLLLGSVSNPFAAEMHRAIEDVAANRGYAVLASSHDDDPAREGTAMAAILGRRVDGVIMMPIAASQAYLQTDIDRGLNVVCVDREPAGALIPSIRSDARVAAAVATRHLIRRGHQRIAMLHDDENIWTARERRNGYLDAMRFAGLDIDDELIVGGLSDPELSGAASDRIIRMQNPPTAIVCGNNLITVGAVRTLQRLSLQHEIGLVGLDDFDTADLMAPPITVVAQRPSQIGRLAADQLFAMIDGTLPRTGSPISVPTDLIERGSGEIGAG